MSEKEEYCQHCYSKPRYLIEVYDTKSYIEDSGNTAGDMFCRQYVCFNCLMSANAEDKAEGKVKDELY